YNCGPGNVNKAIVRSGGKTSFWEISPYLPRETRGYVPAFIAVTYLMNYTAEHNIVAVPPVISYYEADTVYIDNKASFTQIASAIDMPVELLQYLNPIYKKNIIPDGDDSYVLRLPTNKVSTFLSNCDKICPAPDQNSQTAMSGDDGSSDPTMFVSRVVKKYHIVKSRETLTSISSKYSCSASEIKRWNKMKGSHVFKGQKLLVYANIYQKAEPDAKTNTEPEKKAPATDSSETMTTPDAKKAVSVGTEKKTNTIVENSSAKVIFYIVAPGDTLWNIAQRYEVTVEKLKEINNISDTGTLKPGTKLKVVVNG
ncbi:MAG: LysM peptidoglycan-binding domain-containing protein, partial [Bacteroidia bacterium]|nr:LysM peptidoglycan-binding domain-containing protein [Bacteroidia bacterium]